MQGLSPQPPLPLGPLFAMVFNPQGGAAGPAFNGIIYNGEDGDIHLLSSVKSTAARRSDGPQKNDGPSYGGLE